MNYIPHSARQFYYSVEKDPITTAVIACDVTAKSRDPTADCHLTRIMWP